MINITKNVLIAYLMAFVIVVPTYVNTVTLCSIHSI